MPSNSFSEPELEDEDDDDDDNDDDDGDGDGAAGVVVGPRLDDGLRLDVELTLAEVAEAE